MLTCEAVRGLWFAAALLLSCGRTAPYRFPELNGDAGAPPGPVEPPAADGGSCIVSPKARASAWEQHLGEAPFCWGKTFAKNGDVGEYVFAKIPAEADPGWTPHAVDTISFNEPSTLCGPPQVCDCRAGGDFTYFQTSFALAAPAQTLAVSVRDVDDGVQVLLFNAAHPSGFVAGNFTFGVLTISVTQDFGDQTVAGHNRIVLTHVDDCCRERRIANAHVILDGTPLEPCR